MCALPIYVHTGTAKPHLDRARKPSLEAQQQHLFVQPQQFAGIQSLRELPNLESGDHVVHVNLNFQKSREKPAVPPPSTVSIAPVMKSAAGDDRNTTAAASLAAARSIKALRGHQLEVRSLQDYYGC